MELGTKGIFTSSVNLASIEPKKRNISTRQTTQLERIIAQNTFNTSDRNARQMQLADQNLFDWAAQHDRLAVAVGTYKQGKETVTLGLTIAKGIDNWGVETLRFFEIYGQCQSRLAGSFDNMTAIIPFREYADRREYKDKMQRSRFRKILESEMLTAQTNTCYLKDSKGRIFETFPVFDGIKLDPKDNTLQIKLHESTIKHLYQSGLIKYSNIDKLALKYPLSYAIADRLETIYSMDNNIKRDQHNIISVEKLLEIAAKSIPTEAEAGNKPMQLRGAPIIKALDENLEKGILTSWEFCGVKKEQFTDAEKTKCGKEYSAFVKAYIHFEMAIGQDETYQARKDILKKHKPRKAKK